MALVIYAYFAILFLLMMQHKIITITFYLIPFSELTIFTNPEITDYCFYLLSIYCITSIDRELLNQSSMADPPRPNPPNVSNNVNHLSDDAEKDADAIETAAVVRAGGGAADSQAARRSRRKIRIFR